MSDRGLAILGVALLFGLCGVVSFQLSGGDVTHWSLRAELLPATYAISSALLFLRSAKAIFVVPLYIAVWVLAQFIATGVAISNARSDYFPMCLAGLIGGLGVCLASGIVNRRLLSLRYLLGACFVGSVAAVPFGFWLAAYNASIRSSMNAPEGPLQSLRLQLSFAAWQAGVGTYLYVVSTTEAPGKTRQ
jgi:hypothetical protein